MTVSAENAEVLSSQESKPDSAIRIDLESLTCYCEDYSTFRRKLKAFMSGTWNELAVLKSNMDLMEVKRKELPT